ncbi:hypothetical protein HOT82_gp141 [Gordonia phage Ronaldo]|uniref:Uncharacterized protein n=4 Tax=Ronaldovirus TaxID=2733205 RepID=A0A6B9LEN4_9CAUD|nr:hypothetical protein HOT81_gp138 [Gordonia phage Fryberger]YP_009807828.1 hypothetical protein HOT82_gp141 [Gordonia phage Ronaldo]QDH48472.1 hypothetical protein SEA_ZIKO_136 [Gordonia phage Ziko]QHB38248.1 hypothetical protein SEA_VOLT_137 [Gordonia phage Volt]AXN53545.1 hypothetical protein SEA_FRYBERGER_132 [Gordonia phage Fryberger]AXN53692.1 hypothetical protein SEA_RONALDO_134 [Gordonia phage Ronaldo]
MIENYDEALEDAKRIVADFMKEDKYEVCLLAMSLTMAMADVLDDGELIDKILDRSEEFEEDLRD